MTTTTTTSATGAPTEGLPVEIWDSFAILILLVLTALTIICAYVLESRKIKYLHETFVAMVVGALVGLVIKLAESEELKNLVKFDPELFFFLLLPPVIFNCGYDLKRRNFFKNFASIITFAFIGTAISAFAFGFMAYGVVLMQVEPVELGVMDCLVFGSLISATDTVAVIAIFHALHVEPTLFALVFGESVLNDAVAIVIFETMRSFRLADVILFTDVAAAFGDFFLIFTGSFLIGVFFACFSALVYKHTNMREFPHLESSMFVMFAYASYLLAQGIGASGIVSMLFCGIIMAHYTYENLSLKSQQTTKYMFQLVSFISDNFIFTYLGITIFARDGSVYHPFFIFASLIVLLASRAASIFPLAALLNFMNRKKPQSKISFQNQTMLWWAGLRGGMAFALAMKFEDEVIITTTLMLVVVTICVFGGMTAFLLEKLGIPTGVHDDEDDHAPAPAPVTAPKPNQHWFQGFDKRYLRPIFMRPKQEYSRYNEHGTWANNVPTVQAIEMNDHVVAVVEENGRRASNATIPPAERTHDEAYESTGYGALQEEEDLDQMELDAASQPLNK